MSHGLYRIGIDFFERSEYIDNIGQLADIFGDLVFIESQTCQTGNIADLVG